MLPGIVFAIYFVFDFVLTYRAIKNDCKCIDDNKKLMDDKSMLSDRLISLEKYNKELLEENNILKEFVRSYEDKLFEVDDYE